MRLQGKVALISGGARGLGAAQTRLFAQEGAKVVLGDLLAEEGHQLEAEIKARGERCCLCLWMSPVRPHGKMR
jgi:3alpha(or 20beta)-hydroxysteroid dehydrogenase